MPYPADDLYPDEELFPSGNSAGERMLAFLEHLQIDPESDLLLEQHTTALASCLERLAEVAYSQVSILRDPRFAPLWALAHAGLWTGGTMPPRLAGESEITYQERARVEVVRPRGMRRGGVRSLVDVVTPLLSGPVEERYVEVVEHYDEWDTLVITHTDQTPDPAAVAAACNAPDVVVAGERVLHSLTSAPRIGQMTRVINDITVPIDDMTLADVT